MASMNESIIFEIEWIVHNELCVEIDQHQCLLKPETVHPDKLSMSDVLN